MKKGIAALLVGAMSPKKKGGMHDDEMEDSDESEKSDGREAKVAAAEEVMAALKSDDAEAFADALESFMECCDY